MVNSTWDGCIILARVSQIREIFPDELDDPGFELEPALRAERHSKSAAYMHTTETAVVDKPEKADEHGHGHHHGHAH